MPQPVKSRLSTASTFHVSKLSIFMYGLFRMNTPKSCTERVALTGKCETACSVIIGDFLVDQGMGLTYLTENGF
jgi:hypothetical protein